MLYAVKLQGIYTAYSYLSVRATVDLPLPENSIHAILFQLRLLAQRLLFALTSKPQKDIYYISYKGKLSKKLCIERFLPHLHPEGGGKHGYFTDK